MNVFILGVLLFIANPNCGTNYQKFKIFELFLTYVKTADPDQLHIDLIETITEFRKQQLR